MKRYLKLEEKVSRDTLIYEIMSESGHRECHVTYSVFKKLHAHKNYVNYSFLIDSEDLIGSGLPLWLYMAYIGHVTKNDPSLFLYELGMFRKSYIKVTNTPEFTDGAVCFKDLKEEKYYYFTK